MECCRHLSMSSSFPLLSNNFLIQMSAVTAGIVVIRVLVKIKKEEKF